MDMQNWTVTEAKAKFGKLIALARSKGPQPITKRGRIVAMVVGADEWERKTKRTSNLAEFFAGSPLGGSGLKIRRRKPRPRLRRN
jgi:prevent-host-death family protein